MRVLVLSRPIVNAGDFLFSKKSIEAFQMICPDISIVSGHLLDKYDRCFLNQFDSIVCAGGPLYDDNFLENGALFDIYKEIDNILAKVFILSAGWYGRDVSNDFVFSFKFSDTSIKLLKKIIQNGGALSCRDDITNIVLRNNGIDSVSMVGCTAWYDYKLLNHENPNFSGVINKIIISDQGITKDSETWEWKFKSLNNTIYTLKMIYPDAEIIFTFNGGINTKFSTQYNKRVVEILEQKNIKYYEISGSDKGFELCLSCDLHVGFRVHTHIYCMSKRIPSILVSEDARGVSLNQTLGLPDIRDYTLVRGQFTNNQYLNLQLKYYLQRLEEEKFILLKPAYKKMNIIYNNDFVPFIRRICNA